jgi:hypothetical protein
MAYLSDDNMIERALLRLLCPVVPVSVRCVETAYKKKFRRQKRPVVKTHTPQRLPQPARIFVHEILSAHTVSICWSDSQSGYYAEQIWRLGFARNDGFCALTGRPIAEGDDVFRPRRSVACVPANWDRMILASSVSTTIPIRL